SGGNHAGGSATEAQEPRPARRAVATRPRKLDALWSGTGVSLPASSAEIEVRQIACDSRKVLPRSLFFALRGAKADGNEFVRDAVGRGAIAIASENLAPATLPHGVTWIPVLEERKILARVAANFFDHPANALQL